MSTAPFDVGAPHVVAAAGFADELAARTGAWVVLERHGVVLSHGSADSEPPPALVAALLAKRIRPLQQECRWKGRQPWMTGNVQGTRVEALRLGEGATAWIVDRPDSNPMPADAAQLANAVLQPAPFDPYVHSMLNPAGPIRPRAVVPTTLVSVVADGDQHELALAVHRAAAPAGRTHVDGERILAAVPTGHALDDVLARLVRFLANGAAGICAVPPAVADWRQSAALATSAASAARRHGLALGRLEDPRIAADVLAEEARAATLELWAALPRSPLHLLIEGDGAYGETLSASLRSWIDNRFDNNAAAAALNVHPNTLRYRVKRAVDLTGLDLAVPGNLLALQLLAGTASQTQAPCAS